MGIYCEKCEQCNESTKRIEDVVLTDDDGKIEKCMYECDNNKCNIKRTVKRELNRYDFEAQANWRKRLSGNFTLANSVICRYNTIGLNK